MLNLATNNAEQISKEYCVGDFVEVKTSENIWCPAKIISLHDNFKSDSDIPFKLKVEYEGWGRKYNEIISDKMRLATIGTYVEKYKGWVQIPGLPFWPCIIYNRLPVVGSLDGVEYLRNEPNVFVRLCGTLGSKHRKWVNGGWIKTTLVSSFHHHFDIHFHIEEKPGSTVQMNRYMCAVRELQKMDVDLFGYKVLNYDFKFDGSYELDAGEVLDV